MIGFRRKEVRQCAHLGDDRPPERLRRAELGDIGIGDFLLLRIGREDRGSVLRADIRSLPVQLRRIVRHGEEYLQELAIADSLRIVGDLDRFGVAGGAGADGRVAGGGLAAPRISGDGVHHARGVLKHALNAPEAAAREHGLLQAAGGGRVHGRRRQHDGLFGGCGGSRGKAGKREAADGQGRKSQGRDGEATKQMRAHGGPLEWPMMKRSGRMRKGLDGPPGPPFVPSDTSSARPALPSRSDTNS